MTLGVGRGMDLNFATLSVLLRCASHGPGFSVAPLVRATRFHENKVKGHLTWARAMRLVDGNTLAPFAQAILKHDPAFVDARTRAACYVEIATNPEAEVARHICEIVLPRLLDAGGITTTEDVVRILVADGVGVRPGAATQPRKDADLFLRALRSQQGFGPLGLLQAAERASYIASPIQQGAAVLGYTLLRRWPSGATYLRLAEVQDLARPLLLPTSRFKEDIAVLERTGWLTRVTSSGLDQVAPTYGSRAQDLLWTVA